MAYAARLLPMPRLRHGSSLAGAKAYFYVAGTTTPLDTFDEPTLTVGNENENPVEADADGLFGPIYLSARTYKLVLKTSADATIYTQDYISADDVTNVLSKTGTYQILASDGPDILIHADASGGSFVITLPALATSVGVSIKVVKTDSSANTVTVDGSGAETISGDASIVLDEQYDVLAITGTSTQWLRVTPNAVLKPFLLFTPQQNNPPVSAYATQDTRNAHPVLDFDGATDEEAVFSGVLTPGYSGDGLTVDIYCSFTSATSGSVRWQAAIERMDLSSLDVDADSFASFQSAGGTAPGTTGMLIKVSIVFTDGAQMDSLAAGEAFRLKIRRDADGTSGTDDIASDAEIHRVVVRET